MRKTDKKIDNKLRQALTEVCDFALHNITGYQWISHTVNYNQFPDSLMITCMFKNQQSAKHASQQKELSGLILKKLKDQLITLQNSKQIRFEFK